MEYNRKRCWDVLGWRLITNKYKVIAYFYFIMGEHLTVHKVGCLGEETVLVPGCPGIWGFVAPARWQKLKKGMTWT